MTTNNFKPILFSTEMVQAILAGRKTQTRRVVKIEEPFLDYDPKREFYFRFIPNDEWGPLVFYSNKPQGFISAHSDSQVSRYDVNNILWVKETFCESITPEIPGEKKWKYSYKADSSLDAPWKSSRYMPKEAARIFLKVTNVRVERLQDISEEDTKAEGIERDKNGFMPTPDKFWAVDGSALFNSAKLAFIHLWQKINAKKHPWESNPWVWVYEFERIEKPENFLS